MDTGRAHHRLIAAGVPPLAGVLLLAVVLAGCPEPESAHVAPDPQLRVKLLMARRALSQIRERRLRGLEIGGDCRAAERVFFSALEKMRHPSATKLRRDLLQICATDRRDRGQRGVVGQ
ncbi:MAG: hypothetical protein KC503_30725 [Myxococcales bacterium]|nr:hypothetical protein [Myxococcales bacterium]